MQSYETDGIKYKYTACYVIVYNQIINGRIFTKIPWTFG